jgi:DNA-binding GntR family transcriptional regulator
MPRVLTILDDLQLANSRVIFSTIRSAGWRPASIYAHRQIVNALKNHDTGKAVALLDAHIRGLERTVGGGAHDVRATDRRDNLDINIGR